MRNKPKSYKKIPPPLPSSQAQLHSRILYLPPTPSSAGGRRNGGYVQSITRCLCCSFFLTRCPCSSVGSLPRDTVLHELLHHGSLPRDAVLQEQAAPAWVPHGVTSPASKPAPAWASLFRGPQVLPGASSSVGCPWGHSFLQASP